MNTRGRTVAIVQAGIQSITSSLAISTGRLDGHIDQRADTVLAIHTILTVRAINAIGTILTVTDHLCFRHFCIRQAAIGIRIDAQSDFNTARGTDTAWCQLHNAGGDTVLAILPVSAIATTATHSGQPCGHHKR